MCSSQRKTAFFWFFLQALYSPKGIVSARVCRDAGQVKWHWTKLHYAALFQWTKDVYVFGNWKHQFFLFRKKISNTTKLRKESELQVRIELTTLRVLVRMLFPEPKKHAAGPKKLEPEIRPNFSGSHTFSLTECNFQSKTKIEPDLRLKKLWKTWTFNRQTA